MPLIKIPVEIDPEVVGNLRAQAVKMAQEADHQQWLAERIRKLRGFRPRSINLFKSDSEKTEPTS